MQKTAVRPSEQEDQHRREGPPPRPDLAGRLWRRVVYFVISVSILLAVAWPVRAAVELMFFTAESTDTSVLLSWATAREIDVEGYLILCKLDGEPESAYHFIGQRAATGGPNQPAQYSFAVTEGVYYGEQYCFRLEEVTTNDEPGEKRDICGFGPGVTPTPNVGGLAGVPGGSITPIVITPVPGQSPAPTLVTPGPTPTWTPIGQSPLETPTQPESLTATPTQPVSPLGAGANTDAESPTPLPTMLPTSTPLPTQPVSPQATPTATMTTAALAVSGDEGQADQQAGSGSDAATGAVAEGPTPTSMFIVVTATPTAVAVAVAPTFTPLPTATIAPDIGLLGMVSPNAQNMMVMMLCLIFISATGLGTLGLITTILFFRSQSQRRIDDYSYRDRNYSGRRNL